MGKDYRAATTKTAPQKQTSMKSISSMKGDQTKGSHDLAKLKNAGATKITGVAQKTYGSH